MRKISIDGVVYYKCSRCNETFNDNDDDDCPICGHEYVKPFEHNSFSKHLVLEHYELIKTINYGLRTEEFELAEVILQNKKDGVTKYIVERNSQISIIALIIIRNGVERYIEDDIEADLVNPQKFITGQIEIDGNLEEVFIEKKLASIFIEEIYNNGNIPVDFSMKCLSCNEKYHSTFWTKEKVNELNITSQIFKYINSELNKCENCSNQNMWSIDNIEINHIPVNPTEGGIIVQNKKSGITYEINYYQLAQLISTTHIKFNLDFNDIILNHNYKRTSLLLTIHEFLNILNSLWIQPIIPFKKSPYGAYENRMVFFNEFLYFLNNYFELELKGDKITKEELLNLHSFIDGSPSKMDICLITIQSELEQDIHQNKIYYMEGDPNLFPFLKTIYPELKRYYNSTDISIPFFINYMQTRQFLAYYIYKEFGQHFELVNTGFNYEYIEQYRKITYSQIKNNN